MSSSHDPSPAAGRVVRALIALRRELRGDPPQHPPARDFREQLAYIERDLLEMRTRVNALFFTVLTAAIGQLLARLFT
ncbi:MAG: hypothetical protein WC211_11385 [Dehalococcoidia bacterium]